jgi:hypothetical protein
MRNTPTGDISRNRPRRDARLSGDLPGTTGSSIDHR